MNYNEPDDFSVIESLTLNDFADCIPKSPLADDPEMLFATVLGEFHFYTPDFGEDF